MIAVTPYSSLLIFIAALLAGLLGSLTGLGGGVVLTPILVLFFGVPLDLALGTSLISTIATSSGAASAYVKDELSNMRIGMSLEAGTTSGAIAGSLTLYTLEKLNLLSAVAVLFGVVLIISGIPNFARMKNEVASNLKPDYFSRKLKLAGTYRDTALKADVPYVGRRYPYGLAGMFAAGYLSGLLGIGSGAFKVVAMDLVMGLPFKISTATSNFMIGVTAATSSGLYWAFGFIQPVLVASTIPGVLIGAMIGTRYLNRMASRRLRQVFTVVIILLGVEMILRGLVP
ncbi:MAG: sulfite exporter TauE/SafE family protein [Nitrososphaerota archaeon]|nr:sulfite exporter TauE/SafE family protein [Nitrososphaerota archaeon]